MADIRGEEIGYHHSELCGNEHAQRMKLSHGMTAVKTADFLSRTRLNYLEHRELLLEYLFQFASLYHFLSSSQCQFTI